MTHRVPHAEHLGKQRNSEEHHDDVRRRLVRLEVAVLVGVPVELELRVEVHFGFFVPLEGVEGHGDHQDVQVDSPVHGALLEEGLQRVHDVVAVEEVRWHSVPAQFPDRDLPIGGSGLEPERGVDDRGEQE